MDPSKYNYMEGTLQNINKHYISLSDVEVASNNEILQKFLYRIIPEMKRVDTLFASMYTTIFYGGSFYDGVRVGKPEEFDLDLLMALPKYAEPVLSISNRPGFVHVKLEAIEKFKKQPEYTLFKRLESLLDRGYISTVNVRKWIQSVITKALGTFKNGCMDEFSVRISQSGPAFTIKLSLNTTEIDIDLVPCFTFASNKWPVGGYRRNPVPSKPNFFVVPKQPKTAIDVGDRFWRLSFQEQERQLINDKRTLKPALKLLKQLRDEQGHHVIASYFLKTIFLWEDCEKRVDFTRNTLSYNFMIMLKKYMEYVENGRIVYFWNKNFNLLDSIRSDTLINIKNNLRRIIQDIDNHPGDPSIVSKYLVGGNIIQRVMTNDAILAEQPIVGEQPVVESRSICVIS